VSLAERLAAAVDRARIIGAVAGVSVDGAREVAAVGLADAGSRLRLVPSARLPVASLTKPVVATAVVRAWQARGVALDTPLVELLPALAPDWRAERTLSIRHLLSHTSGLRPDLTPDEAESYGYMPGALAQAVRATVHRGQIRRPGAAWQYGNAGYGLAGYALATMVGGSFEEALAAELLTPAGMKRSGFGDADATGHSHGQPVRPTYWPARRPGGGLVSTVEDLLAFAEFAVADEPSLSATGRAVAPSLFGSAYGLGWNLNHGGRVRWHSGDWGGCHSILLVVPDRRLAVAVVVNDDAGLALRSELAWSESAATTGLRRPRIGAWLRIAHAAGRSALATLRRPRTLAR
jgi:CubicO group peptidase (beta-lactamase class C family)